MAKLSRRQLARYAADKLSSGESAKSLAAQLAAVMIESKKADQIELLASDIAWELEQRQLASNAEVVSAHPLTAELRKQVRIFIKKATKADEVILQERLEPSLIGGLRIETADKSWDKSVRAALTEIREAF
jgi:F-type H+-transporting ATPase subunit delta